MLVMSKTLEIFVESRLFFSLWHFVLHSSFLSVLAVGASSVVVGHPLDTVKVCQTSGIILLLHSSTFITAVCVL